LPYFDIGLWLSDPETRRIPICGTPGATRTPETRFRKSLVGITTLANKFAPITRLFLVSFLRVRVSTS